MRPPSGTPSYAAERVNLDMTARVYEVAAATGVRRVVCTSTNQAAKWYERAWKQGRRDRVTSEDYPRPDTFYGWAKTAYETLGFLFATGEVSRPLEVVQIRIVAPRPIRAETFTDRQLVDYLRDIAGWISERDLQAALRPLDRGRVDRRPRRRAVPDLLRGQRECPDLLVDQQRPRGDRLRTRG